ncbi:biotin--[acetyl-CoA-carboxylase] ligase [Hellea balneolensis]|uniref:biotin--[acetyl-CoA-carboxylase] ligase n=1 Tax=Hellea balneolensis TaxID=287478 RepID=UPI0003F6C0FB|nr:biotin--[acetyl-CoA-carboxylase] ligase [Hellea balneolensis]
MRFIELDSVDSTNAQAKRLAEQGDFGPVWIRADKQSAGRGRRGRTWTSETGNLFCSGLYPHDGNAHQLAQLSFAASLALADTLEHYVPRNLISLKWPNDVLLARAKTAGILLESGHTQLNIAHHQKWIVVGIGVNLTHHPDMTEYPATHVMAHIPQEKLTGPEPVMTGAQTVLAILAARFTHWRHMLLTQGFAPIGQAWMERSYNIPGAVNVRLPSETFTGEALGLDQNGALRVRLENGTIRDVHAGDVFFGAE